MSVRIRRVVCPIVLVSAESARAPETARDGARSASRTVPPAMPAVDRPVGLLAGGARPPRPRVAQSAGLGRGSGGADNSGGARRPLIARSARPDASSIGEQASAAGSARPPIGAQRPPIARPRAPLAPAPPSAAVRADGPVGLAPADVSLHGRTTALRSEPLVVAQTRRLAEAALLSPLALLGSSVRQRLTRDGGEGAPLADEQRTEMETIVGTELRGTRIHTDDASANVAAELRAEAFTIGQDVYFGRGSYDPTSQRGRALLAHELVHVRQQARSGGDRLLAHGGAADGAEAEAVAIERAVLSGPPRGAAANLTVGSYVRSYTTDDPRGLSPEEQARLDAISMPALDACRELLSARPGAPLPAQIESLEVDVTLDLASMTDDQAARTWGQAIYDRLTAGQGVGP